MRENPWKSVSLDSYEKHMSLDSVLQLQTMNRMMKEQFHRDPAEKIMIFGIAGGNGLEHIDPEKIKKVYGVDINENYLNACRERYRELRDTFEGVLADITQEEYELPKADKAVANLFIEYVGYDSFIKAVKKTGARYVSCIIQVNTDDSFVSESPYLHEFDDLVLVHHQIDEKGLTEALAAEGFILKEKKEEELPNGKKLVQMDFEREGVSMFREMRRQKQQLSEKETIAVLERGTSGVLVVSGDGGYPYAVPLSYVYRDGKIYFHCAKTGHKIDAIKENDKVSFCVIDQDEIVSEKYTTYFRSVIAFGRARIMEDPKEIWDAIDALAQKYAPHDSAENRQKAIEKDVAPMLMVEITIEHMTGKEAIELVRRR